MGEIAPGNQVGGNDTYQGGFREEVGLLTESAGDYYVYHGRTTQQLKYLSLSTYTLTVRSGKGTQLSIIRTAGRQKGIFGVWRNFVA